MGWSSKRRMCLHQFLVTSFLTPVHLSAFKVVQTKRLEPNIYCVNAIISALTRAEKWRLLQLTQSQISYTPGSTNIAGWKMDPEWRWISGFEHADFSSSMLVYQRVYFSVLCFFVDLHQGNVQFKEVWTNKMEKTMDMWHIHMINMEFINLWKIIWC